MRCGSLHSISFVLFVATATLASCGSEDTDIAEASSPDAGHDAQGGSAGQAGSGGSAGAAGQAGTGGSPDAGAEITSIADLKQNDANGVPLMLGQTVTIRGVVTVATDMFSVENNELWVQDDTGGVSVYEASKQSFDAQLGDDLLITGVVSQYAGKTEINDPEFLRMGAGLPQPEPKETTTAALCGSGEPLDGDLVVLRSVQIVGGEAWPVTYRDGNTNLMVDDGSGPCALRLDHHTEFNGSPEPAGPFDAAGVVKQYDETAPFDSGYALQPRFASDIVTSR